ncbi:uncharacterized protein G2W53_004801 [Senna tora]|uniref:RNase H type-1 domain-containing protein n=1 Tax=Senna tora TaxID=362788 RepID=A0A834XFX2_9FABA|nr:uncharacterized protein G2W53_004801 [Senna tora]
MCSEVKAEGANERKHSERGRRRDTRLQRNYKPEWTNASSPWETQPSKPPTFESRDYAGRGTSGRNTEGPRRAKGGLVRDAEGLCRGVVMDYLSSLNDIVLLEALAIKKGLDLVHKIGAKRVVVKCDARPVTDILKIPCSQSSHAEYNL